MRKDIPRFCNACLITVSANVAQCPTCRKDSNFSYFGGMYYDKFHMYSYSKVEGEAADIQLMYQYQRKDIIEPLLDRLDREGSYDGYIVKDPRSGKIVYMTPLETLREAPSKKSGCLVLLATLNLGGWILSSFVL